MIIYIYIEIFSSIYIFLFQVCLWNVKLPFKRKTIPVTQLIVWLEGVRIASNCLQVYIHSGLVIIWGQVV